MPFMYSISAGISLGIISYVGINLFHWEEGENLTTYVRTHSPVCPKYMMLYS